MKMGKISIWVSDVADPCGIWEGAGKMTVFDCKGILKWPCGRFLGPEGKWQSVPGGRYEDLPFRCGHLEVEVPPGCYWVLAGNVTPGHGVHLNYTTHVGIVQVRCEETSCVKIYNPTIRLCWDWFRVGLRTLAARGEANIDRERVQQLEKIVEDLLQDVPQLPVERMIEGVFDRLTESAEK